MPVLNTVLQVITRLGPARLAAMGAVAALMLGFFAFLVIRASTPTLAPLYTGLALDDSAAIVKELEAQNVPYELRGDGESVLVPREQIAKLRMTLAETGLPNRGQVGYEIFDQQNTLGATSFVQNINNVRALEGELARTISSLARIKSARVHLVLPERELFQRDKKEPSAAIVLAVRGTLSSGEIRAIQHLVASSIEGMSPARVSIVDDSGTLLASGAGDDDSVLAGQVEERALSVENRLRDRVGEMLDNVLGSGRARVQVSAELDFNRSTKTSETFNPDGQVVRSTQTKDLANQATGPGNSGQVSVSNELPGASQNAGGDAGTSEQQRNTEETTNYEISKTTETAVTEAGSVKRLSVAVVVDGIYTDDGKGGFTYAPRPAEDIQRITTLVRSAVGFDETRGDKVEVVNMQFASGPQSASAGTAAPGLFDFSRDDLMNGAQMLVTLLIALALVFFVMRPLLKKVLSPEVQPLALTAAVGDGGTGTDLVALGPDGAPMPREMIAADTEAQKVDAKTAAWVANARQMGEAQLQRLQSVGQLVEQNPKQAAQIVREWMRSAA